MKQFITTYLFLLGIALTTSAIYAQELSGTAASERVKGAVRVRMNATGDFPLSIHFSPSQRQTVDGLKRDVFGMREQDALVLQRTETDELGMTHTRFQQQYNHLNVEGYVYIFHSRNGNVSSANGYFLPGITVSTTPVLSDDQALNAALKGMKQPLTKDVLETQTTELVILPINGSAFLAYKCLVSSHHPLVVSSCVYVDAASGKILKELNQLCSFDSDGIGHSQFSGIQTITTDSISPTLFQLRDLSRGDGIETINYGTSAVYTDSDNDWNNINVSMDEFAIDAHFGAEATYDFYYDEFGRSSYDNAGGFIRSYVNDPMVGVNAYWDGTLNEMHYGNGDQNYFPVISLEVVGHEISHGVTQYTAGLIYEGESGALNESFSDIFGNTIRFLNAPDSATWYIGDQLLRPGQFGEEAFRNMANPNEFQNADCYGGLYFNNGDVVHYDSGIQNFWYYLLTEGGNGTNDIGNTYSVDAIGMNDAMKIAYRNLAYYLTPTSTFMDAREGAELAAADLFGPCSVQLEATIAAWYAVGVGPETSQNFTLQINIDNNFACSAPLTSNFSSNYTYDSYFWDFGDGTTSTDATPSHTYNADGAYTVTLEVSSSVGGGCQDSLTLIDAVVIDEIDPIAEFSSDLVPNTTAPVTFVDQSLYGPTSWEWSFGDGETATAQNPIHTYSLSGTYDVQLIVHNCHGTDTIVHQIDVADLILFCSTIGTDKPSGVIYDSGGESGNYADGEICSLSILPCNATSITLNVEQLDIENWYDYLTIRDGSGPASPIIVQLTGNQTPTPITATSGRMYIEFSSDLSVNLSGFKLSYTSVIGSPGTITPAFASNPTIPVAGISTQFYDQTVGFPVSWFWNFGDGFSSTDQYPSHTFTNTGTYTVTLTVAFCDGTTTSSSQVFQIDEGVGLSELSKDNLVLSVAPNPFGEQFSLLSNTELKHVTLNLLDFSGRSVHLQEETNPSVDGIVVSPGKLSIGSYMLEVSYELENGTPGFERFKLQVVQ